MTISTHTKQFVASMAAMPTQHAPISDQPTSVPHDPRPAPEPPPKATDAPPPPEPAEDRRDPDWGFMAWRRMRQAIALLGEFTLDQGTHHRARR